MIDIFLIILLLCNAILLADNIKRLILFISERK